MRLYEFIIKVNDMESLRYVYWVKAQSAKDALIEFSEYEGFTGAELEALIAVSFESAIKLFNGWSIDKITNIHDIGNVLYGEPEKTIENVMLI